MIRRRLFLAAVAVAAPISARAQLKMPPPAQTATKWYVVRVADDAFTVEMPGVPDHRIINDASARGMPFMLHSYSLEFGGNSYVAQTAVYSEDVDTSQPRRMLRAMLDGRAAQLAGRKWDKTEWREIDGGASVESLGTLANGSQLRLLSLQKYRRFISIAFLGPNATVPDADRFFKSLKVT
jgi:hypothetical protein